MKTFILFVFGVFDDMEDIEYFCMEVLGQSEAIKEVRYVIESNNNTNIILNGCVWDGNTATWQNPFANTHLLQTQNCMIGWTITGNTIVNPANTEEFLLV
mgnify:CR=1 FL=1